MKPARTIDGSTPPGSPKATSPPLEVGSQRSIGFFLLFALTVFLSAFLLFQVQPLIGKFILPWFGGTPAVWTTCMLFFQVVLFAGYAYAHLTIRWLGPRRQPVLHVVLLLAACAALPIVPGAAWKPTGTEEPIFRILSLLAVTVGFPYFILSATGPLLQSWYSQLHQGRSPYRLYSLSNAGSLLALITFPAAFEPIFPNRHLASLWSWSFAVFAVLCGFCAWMAAKAARASIAEPRRGSSKKTTVSSVAPGTGLLWFALAMFPSILLLAVTNRLCLDVASVPFLWVLPLTLYLLSFILCFDGERWYSRRFIMPVTAVALACAYPLLRFGEHLPMVVQIGAYSVVFFLCAMVCHGELARRKPDVQHLTSFYLAIAGGGAAGGIVVAIAAPLVFSDYYELQVGLFGCAVLMLVVLYTDGQSRLFRGRPHGAWLAMLVGVAVLGAMLLDQVQDSGGSRVRSVSRSFYGVLKVSETEALYKKSVQTIEMLRNGTTLHGAEYVDPRLWLVPTSYFDMTSGVGLVMCQNARPKSWKVGVVGLGVGTLATYATPGDEFRFYEINARDEEVARQYFHFLGECHGKVEVVIGDARLSLEREPPQNFDVLVLDAFSSDSIPVHLLTKEAFAIYLRHLKPNGIIAVNISNKHLSPGRVVEAIAESYELTTGSVNSGLSNVGGVFSEWMLLARNPKVIRDLQLPPTGDRPQLDRVLWTDDHASLFSVWGR